MGDQIVDIGGGDGHFHTSVATLNDIVARENIEYLHSLEGVEGIAGSVSSSTTTGLNADEAADGYAARIATFGTNKYDDPPQKSFLELIWDALGDTTLRILLAAAIFSLIIGASVPAKYLAPDEKEGNLIEGGSILGTVAVVVLVTSFQEWEKQKQFRELEKAKNNFKVKVLRGSVETQIDTNDVLVGDVVILDTGDQVPADGIFISGFDLAIDESSMTGENESRKKSAEKDPFLISGTRVTDGIGRMLVLSTGMNSKYGKLMATMNEESPDTPLQERLDGLAGLVGIVGTVVAVATFIALMIYWIIKVSKVKWQWVFLIDWIGFVIQAITIIVVAVPEGLPLAVTISLAYSMKQMMNDQNLVRRLAACETMGGATTICSDKTGTLTENRMTVVEGWISGKTFKEVPLKRKLDDLSQQILTESIGINSKAIVNYSQAGNPDFIGNKTECALLVFSKNSLGVDYNDVRNNLEVVKLYTFSSARKRMSTIVANTGAGKGKKKNVESGALPYRLHCKGASEIILARCTTQLDENGNVVPLSKTQIKTMEKQIDTMAEKGLRTLTLAYKDVEHYDYEEAPEDDMTLVAILGIMDPVRQGVPDAVASCQRAGIVVRMVTGDNVKTATKISEDCGIYTPGGTILEGPEFQKMTDEELDAVLPSLQVLARAQPLDKFRLVERLQALGHVVAVTGDGTNDAPALKLSDVGLAMGIMGTEVAKSAADIIILDDNFVSIVRSVLWGRNVYDNIRKFIQFQLTVNVVALVIAFTGAVTQRGTPLKAVQLLWVNLIMDTFAALALGTEKPTESLLNRRPYGRESPLIAPIMWRNIIGQSIYQIVVLFIVLYAGAHIFEVQDGKDVAHGATQHYTMIFNIFVYCQIFNEINARSVSHDKLNVFAGFFDNFIFISVIVGTFIVQIILVQWCGPFATTAPLTVGQWFICIALGFGSLPVGFLLRFIPTPPETHESNYLRMESTD
jgi:Ca2+-transporting ATPase